MPSETVPNFGRLRQDLPHDSMNVAAGVVISIMASFSVAICIIRIYVRKCIRHTFGWDDVAVIIALIFVLAFAALSLMLTVYGAGQHIWDVDPADLKVFLGGYYAAVCSFLIVSLFVKCSLLLFLMRVFPYKLIHDIGKYLLGMLVLFTLTGEFPLAFRCAPVSAAYDTSVRGAKCFAPRVVFALAMYQSVVMFASNLIICAMPILALWRLRVQISLRKRMVLLTICVFGIGVTIASLVRFVLLVFGRDQADFTYYTGTTLLWVNLEFCLGIVASSIPALGSFFQKDEPACLCSEGSAGCAGCEEGHGSECSRASQGSRGAEDSKV